MFFNFVFFTYRELCLMHLLQVWCGSIILNFYSTEFQIHVQKINCIISLISVLFNTVTFVLFIVLQLLILMLLLLLLYLGFSLFAISDKIGVDISLLHSLVFSTLIAAVDPVAVCIYRLLTNVIEKSIPSNQMNLFFQLLYNYACSQCNILLNIS